MDGIDVAVADLRLDGEIVELVPVRHTEVPYPTTCAIVSSTRSRRARAARRNSAGSTPWSGRLRLCGRGHGRGRAGRLAGPDRLPLGRGRPLPRHAATRPARLDRRGHRPAGGRRPARARTSRRAGTAPRWRARWTSCGWPTRTGPPRRSTSAASPNITVVTPDGPTLAYDTGPGNALLDLAVRRSSSGARHFDEGGALAGTGSPRTDLLERLLADPYYARAAPKSTGKEHFHGDYLDTALAGLPEPTEADLLATLVELTAVTIARECNAHGVRRVVASGGGVRNSTLMAALGRHLGSTEVVSSAELGLPDDAKEAYLSALLGFLTWHGLPANRPDATGAAGPRLLGSITPGAEPLRLPGPARTPITRLRVGEPVNDVVGGSRARP